MRSARVLRRALRAPVPHAIVVALVAMLVGVPGPVGDVQAGQGSGDRSRPQRSARPIERAGIPARDRAALAGLPAQSRVGYHAGTGRVRFLAGSTEQPLVGGPASLGGLRRKAGRADLEAAAERFLRSLGPVFGAADAGRDLRVMRGRTRVARMRGHASVVRFQQLRSGRPVLGGELTIRLSPRADVLSASGELLPARARVPTRPAIDADAAARVATAWLSRATRRTVVSVRMRSRGLAIHDARLLGGPAPATAPWARRPRLVWLIDARVADPRGTVDDRLVLVDARRGHVVASIPLDPRVVRRVCDSRNVRRADHRCTRPYTRSEGEPPSRVGDVDAAYRLMGVVESWYRTRFERDGIDGRGARMKARVRHCSTTSACPWNNGQWHWADQQAVFGRGWSKADDIVAHEFTHGVLDHEARLFYHYQSGALNEMFADIFGEVIDQSYPGGRDTSFTRWRIGEDTPIGAFRDMRDPTRFGHPDRVRSPRWHSSPTDNGGVHRNSGVGNKAAYLIAAGGAFNGEVIEGIGVERMARLFYVVMTEWLTSASDYADLGDALKGACSDLRGTFGFTDDHCSSVARTVTATQMLLRPVPPAPSEAPVCGAGKAPVDVFFDDLEDTASGRWRQTTFVGGARGWYYPPNPNDDRSWDGTWASSGDKNLYGVDRPTRSDAVMRLVPPIEGLPEGAFLRFEHGYSFDRGSRRFDGSVVEIRVDGGTWQGVDELFTHGGYDGTIASGTGNPLKGRRAFTGESHGYGASRIDLSGFAGRSLELRFRIGTDRSGGGHGWYVDDVRVYACAPA